MSLSKSRILIYGYIKRIEQDYVLSMTIPDALFQLISLFYPKYAIYGVGRNEHGALGLKWEHEQKGQEFDTYITTTKWHYLSTMSSLCCDPEFISCGDKNFFLRNIHNEIFSAGNNSYGCCGVNSSEHTVERFTKIIFHRKENNIDINDYVIDIISNGAYTEHIFIVLLNKYDDTQLIFAFGHNNSEQQGHGNFDFISYPQKVESLNQLFSKSNRKIIQISNGIRHSLFLCSNGRVYSFGLNSYGQCGVVLDRNKISHIEGAQLVPWLYDIIKISSGEYHNLCIDKLNRVWVFGSNDDDQLGLGQEYEGKESIDNAIMNPWFDGKNDDNKIIFVSCGDEFSLCISINGKAYLFGNNTYGQIGNGKSDDSVSIPYCIQSKKKYKDIRFESGDCGNYHALLISNIPSNQLYSIGCNTYKQTGNFKNECDQTEIYLVNKKDIGVDETASIVRSIADDELTVIICEL